MLYLTTNADYVNQNGRFFPCYDKDKTILRKKQVNFYLRYFLSIERIFKSSEIVLRRDSTRRKPTRSIEQTKSKSARSAKKTRSNNIKTAFYRKDRKTLEKTCQCFLYSRVKAPLRDAASRGAVRRLLPRVPSTREKPEKGTPRATKTATAVHSFAIFPAASGTQPTTGRRSHTAPSTERGHRTPTSDQRRNGRAQS